MYDDGKGNVRLNGMTATDCGCWFAEQWEHELQYLWTELQAEMVANPTMIPMVIRSELFEMASWRMLDRTKRGL